MRIADEKLLLRLKKKGGVIIDTKQLTQLEIDNKLEETLNLYILIKLKQANLINEKEYYYLKDKIINFANKSTELRKNVI